MFEVFLGTRLEWVTDTYENAVIALVGEYDFKNIEEYIHNVRYINQYGQTENGKGKIIERKF